MAVIAARRYIAGKPSEQAVVVDGLKRGQVPGGESLEGESLAGSFDWLGLAEPSAEEMETVRRQYGLHSLAAEDALNPNQLPKVEIYGKTLFIVARTAAIGEGENITYGQTSIFLSKDFIISVRFGSTRAHDQLRARLETNAEQLAEGPDFVAHAILDFIVDGYQPIMDRLEEVVQELEERAITVFPKQSTIRRIFRLRRQMRRFERIIGPMEEMCQRLVEADLPAIDRAAHIWFRDVLDHIRRTMTRVRALRETLVSIVETASLLEQHRQGEMTRQLAAWAAILAVPTAIAGIYGMNFRFMPELEWKYSYFVVLGGIATICIGLWLRFRRIGWL